MKFSYESEKKELVRIAENLDRMKRDGLEDTEEYEKLSEAWQDLANEVVIGELFYGTEDG